MKIEVKAMDKILTQFKEHLILNGKKPTTYCNRVRRFLSQIKVEEITQEKVNSYLVKQKENNAIETVNLDIKSLKVFFKFLKKDIELPKLYKATVKIPETISLDYFEKEILPVTDCIFKNPLKAKTILSFMLYTGMRKQELLTIKRKDINLENRTVKIYSSKSNKEEEKPFSKKLIPLLKTYFISEQETINAFNITKNSVDYLFKALKVYFKDINLHPHILRHSISTHLYEKGASLEFIKDFLGHKNIETTVRYLGKTNRATKQLYDRYIK